jgi:hypothetical protein
VAPDGYLRSVLADGARPFRYRTGVHELLGELPDTSLWVRFAPAAPRPGFSYLRRYGEGPADVPVGAPDWLTLATHDPVEVSGTMAEAPVLPQSEAPVLPRAEAPVPLQSEPPDNPPAAGPAPGTTVVIPGTTTRPDRPGPPPSRAGSAPPILSDPVQPQPPVRSGGTHLGGAPARAPVEARPSATGTGRPVPPGPAPSPPTVSGPGQAGTGAPVATAGPAAARSPAPAPPAPPRMGPTAPLKTRPATLPGTGPSPAPPRPSGGPPRPVPGDPATRPGTVPQSWRAPTKPVSAAWPTPVTQPAEPSTGVSVSAAPHRRRAAPRPVPPPADGVAPGPRPSAPPPPDTAPPPAVVTLAAEPIPAGTPLFWGRRHMTRLRARILR